jgi:hypothetical protein
MKNTILLAFALAGFGVTAFPADQRIAFERNDAVYIANRILTAQARKRSPREFFRRSRPMALRSPSTPWRKQATQLTCVTSLSSTLPPES